MPDLGLLAPAWLLALPFAWLLPWWLGRRGGHLPMLFAPLAVRHPGAGVHATEAPGGGAPDRRHWLALPVLALLCVALAEPVRYGPPLPAKAPPLDIVLVVDVSVSMTLRDYQVDGERVDRLTMAKRLLDRFAARFGGERLALVVLGRPSAIWSPPTADRALVRHLLGRLQLTMAGRNAAIGDALALTAERFGSERLPIVVLISDAAYPLGRLSPLEGADRLAAAGMTLYSIAIGSADAAAAGAERGGLIFAATDLALLEAMAERTGGRLFHAVDAQVMAEALDRIESIHRDALPEAESPRQRLPLYPWPLGLALFILAAWPWWPMHASRVVSE
jgi:Ca-activated chloride channel family protein